MLTGWFDKRIDTNEYPPNPNVTVFEWLAKQPAFKGRVGAVATWDAFHHISNPQRAGIDVIAGQRDAFPGAPATDARRTQLNELYRTQIHYWEGNQFDAPMHLVAREYIRARSPRVLFVGYGETDEWAHGGRYDLVLRLIDLREHMREHGRLHPARCATTALSLWLPHAARYACDGAVPLK